MTTLHVSKAERAILEAINGLPPCPSNQDVADVLGVSRQAANRIIGELRRRGYLRKISDRRERNFEISPKGMKALKEKP